MRYIIDTPFGGEGFLDPFFAMLQDLDDTIVIEINSPGGEYTTFLAAIAKVLECKALGKKIVCYGTGHTCSAGAGLLWVGDEVYLTPYTYVVFHQVFNTSPSLIQGAIDFFLNLKYKYWYKRRTDLEVMNTTMNSFIPWDKILEVSGGTSRDGDFYFTGEELAKMFPDKIKLEVPPYQLDYWEPPIYATDVT